MSLIDFNVDVEGYSGPFDLLCSLVESKKFHVSDLKISQLIEIYGEYLITTKQAPADTLAEFFYMTSSLLLAKTLSLLPGEEPIDESEDLQANEKFLKSLERYKFFRPIFARMNETLEARSKFFRRDVPQAVHEPEQEIIIADSGAYKLAQTWKSLNDRMVQRFQEKMKLAEAAQKTDWDGFADTDQEQIDERVTELEEMLRVQPTLSFNEICTSRSNCVVTLLALLELCRMGKANFYQEELFSDVRINAKN